MQVLVWIACGGSTLARQSNESRSEYCLLGDVAGLDSVVVSVAGCSPSAGDHVCD
jgi:hypothetical protein